jgi:hypothetical protein
MEVSDRLNEKRMQNFCRTTLKEGTVCEKESVLGQFVRQSHY